MATRRKKKKVSGSPVRATSRGNKRGGLPSPPARAPRGVTRAKPSRTGAKASQNAKRPHKKATASPTKAGREKKGRRREKAAGSKGPSKNPGSNKVRNLRQSSRPAPKSKPEPKRRKKSPAPKRDAVGRFSKRQTYRVQIDLVSLAQVKAAGKGPPPERVSSAMRQALRATLKRMAKDDPATAKEGYFALGLVRAISRQMTGSKWEKQDAWIGATDYLTAYQSEWPAVMAGPNKVKQYRAAVLSVRVDGFFRAEGK